MSLSRVLRFGFALALTAYLLFRSDPAAVARAAAGAHARWIALAILLVVVDRAINGYRWVLLLAALDPASRPSVGDVIRIFFTSSFVGNFLPSVGGDIYRAFQLSRLGVAAAEAGASVLMDRAVGVLSMVTVAAAALAFLRDIPLPGVLPALAAVSFACAVAGATIFSETVAGRMLRAVSALPGARIRRVAARALEAIRRYHRHRTVLGAVLLLSVLVQLLRVVQAYCLGRALDVPLPILVYLGLIPVITLVMQVPITVAGLGTTQAAFSWMFGHAGVPAASSFTMSLLFLALGTLGNLPGGFLYLTAPRVAPLREPR